MVYGVLGGLGRFFGIDPTWLRIAFALGTLFTAIIPGIMVYVILALLIPSDVHVKGLASTEQWPDSKERDPADLCRPIDFW